jgi:hypothetical protein
LLFFSGVLGAAGGIAWSLGLKNIRQWEKALFGWLGINTIRGDMHMCLLIDTYALGDLCGCKT